MFENCTARQVVAEVEHPGIVALELIAQPVGEPDALCRKGARPHDPAVAACSRRWCAPTRSLSKRLSVDRPCCTRSGLFMAQGRRLRQRKNCDSNLGVQQTC
jgi:hypothetical protein